MAGVAMLSNAETQRLRRPVADDLKQARELATRRIWLPKFVYDILPWFYVSAGVAAILATLYINDWFWIVPHYVLFAGGCFHLGAIVFRKRASARSSVSPATRS